MVYAAATLGNITLEKKHYIQLLSRGNHYHYNLCKCESELGKVSPTQLFSPTDKIAYLFLVLWRIQNKTSEA